MTARRMLVLLVVLGAIGIPAGILNALCVGRSCADPTPDGPAVPFCPLPEPLRALLVDGYREGRSPDVLGVADRVPVVTDLGGTFAPWPAVGSELDLRVPIVFAGAGVRAGAEIPDDVALADVAPTIAEILGFERPFPEVRSGTAVPGVADGEAPTLVLLVTWKWTGTADLEAAPDRWPFLASLLDQGAGTLSGRIGSLPIDPTATLTTIGAGGPPSEHGVTGSVVRNEEGQVVPAFGDGAPVPIIAALADDLDDASGRSRIGLVATDELDRGLIGGRWYEGSDDDEVTVATGPDAVESARAMLASMGQSEDTDLLGVVLDGPVRAMDRRTEQIVRAARAAAGGSVLVVVAATGSVRAGEGAPPDDLVIEAVERAVPGAAVVAATVPGGMFLDRDALTAAGVTGQVAVEALLGVTDEDGREMMADAFQGFAVSFARYC